jgi:nucleoside-diphosphate-sugar epimerase
MGRTVSWPSQGRHLGHIFYCAGLTADYARRPLETVEAHAALLSRVLASDNWDSLVYLSSTRLYDCQPLGRGGFESGSFQLDPAQSRHLYDISKLLGENLCHIMGQGRARIARLACVYQDDADPDGFLAYLLRRILKSPPGQAIVVDSSPSYERDYVHLGDVVDALIRIAVDGNQTVYNVASGVNVKNSELASILADLTGVRLMFSGSEVPLPAPLVDRSAISELLGHPPRSLADALVSWVKSMGLNRDRAH